MSESIAQEARAEGPRPARSAEIDLFAAGRSLLVTHELARDRWDDRQIRRMYTHVLTRWAADLLELRRRGLDVPGGASDDSTPFHGESRDGGRSGKIRMKA